MRYWETGQRRSEEARFGPVVRSGLPCGNPRSLPFGPTRVGPWMRRLGPAMVQARQHVALDGVARAVRNSHQTSPHPPGPRAGRAARGNRERHLAKECVGSDRVRKERSRLPEAKRRQPRRTPTKRPRERRRIPCDQRTTRGPTYAQRYGYAPTQRKTVSRLTCSFRNGPTRACH
jgi:hypothetical protein